MTEAEVNGTANTLLNLVKTNSALNADASANSQLDLGVHGQNQEHVLFKLSKGLDLQLSYSGGNDQ
ncbi:hypothetical protein GCM10008967_10040 [Bacillus carboniphilus]|uniref:Uncharacterized protein n=1 Tax=Bacillus carboniphilus TaxID=86663 RepID=A0ABP3FN59_9BACI